MSLIEHHPSPIRNNQAGSPWRIPALATRCRFLWDDGQSAAIIARTLWAEFSSVMARELTRNAVLGYADRKGFPHRRTVTSIKKHGVPRQRKHTPHRFMPDFRGKRESEPMTQAERQANADKRRFRFAEVEIVDLPPEESAVAVSFLGLTDKNCHWPLGDLRDMDAMKFCGAEQFSEHPYCLRHCRMAYVAPPRRADRQGA